MNVRGKKIDRPPAPMKRAIIAVKGPPSPQKTLIAGKLANFFRYMLIDQDDVVLPSFPNKSTTDLSLQMLIQIASANLDGARNGVVINGDFPSNNQIQKLIVLRRTRDVRLLIIQCLPLGDSEEIYDGYEASKMSVDISKRFDLEEFLPDLICQLFPESGLAPRMKKRWEEIDVLAQHLHDFSLYPSASARKYLNSSCSNCSVVFLSHDSTYGCLECEEYTFHDKCAERLWSDDPNGDIEEFRRKCPSYLAGKDLSDSFRYEFPMTMPCRDCRITGFSPECLRCLFETHIRSKILPTVINRKQIHEHALSIIVAPVEVNYTYCCRVCGLTGKHVGYKCSECCVDFHPGCAMLPESTVEKGHRQ